MDEVILDEADGIGYEVPEVPHIEAIFQGVQDSLENVNGSESLTQAQIYLSGVLSGAGTYNLNRVEGNEGFFSSIGGGIKAGIEYIKKMFKQLWEFFFKRDADKLVNETKADLEKCEKSLEAAASGGSNPAETDKILNEQVSKLKGIEGASEGEVAALITEGEKAQKGSNDDKKKVIKQISEKFPALDKKTRAKLDSEIDKAISATKAFIKVMEDAITDPNITPGAKKLVERLKPETSRQKDILKALEDGRSLKNITEAKQLLDAFTKDVKGFETLVKEFKSMESVIKVEINNLDKITDKDNAKGKEDLIDLKGQLAIISVIVKVMKAVLSRMGSVGWTTLNLFGLKG